MSASAITSTTTDLPLSPAPIAAHQIIAGRPEARCAEVGRSSDGLATTVVWACTEGEFSWHYDVDETIHILEGSATIASNAMPPKRFGPGDVVSFRRGVTARWQVHGHVRKLAFCTRVQPRLVGLLLRVAAKLKRMLTPTMALAGGQIANSAALIAPCLLAL